MGAGHMELVWKKWGEGYQETTVAWCHLSPTLERADPVGGDGRSSMG